MEHKRFCEESNSMQYFDGNGTEIKAGMILRHKDGEENKVYECGNSSGLKDLGFMATNPKFLKRFVDWPTEYYPLSQYNLAEWVISDDSAERIRKALSIAWQYSQISGEQHKDWSIDQMVRALCGSEDAYQKWVKAYRQGFSDDPKDQYEWNAGIAPSLIESGCSTNGVNHEG